MKNIAILTGATGGLGREFLKQLLNEDIDEILSDLQKNLPTA